MKNETDFIVIVDEETGQIIATDNIYEYAKWQLENETRRTTRNFAIIEVVAVAATVGIFKKINDYRRSRGD